MRVVATPRRLADSNCCKDSLSHGWPPLTTAALARPNNAATKSFVYLIYDPDARLVKIGVSRNIEKRLKALRWERGSDRLGIVGCLAGSFPLERELHAEFADTRVEGEWFRPSQRILDLVYACGDACRRKDDKGADYTAELTPEPPTMDEAIAYMLGVSVATLRREFPLVKEVAAS